MAREIHFQCPYCNSAYSLDASMAGSKAQCHECSGKFIVPEADGVARPAKAPPTGAPPSGETNPTAGRGRGGGGLSRNGVLAAVGVVVLVFLGLWIFWTQGRSPASSAAEGGEMAFSPVSEESLVPVVPGSPPTSATRVAPATLPEREDIGYGMGEALEFASAVPPEKSLTLRLPFDGSLDNAVDPAKPAKGGGKYAYIEGVSGKAVKLVSKEGYNNTFRLPDQSLPKDSGTLTMWLKHGEALGAMWGLGVMLTPKDGEDSVWAFNWSEHYYRWCLDMFGGGVKSDYFMPDHNEWVHFAIVWDRTRNFQRLYLDGRLSGYSSSMSLPNPSLAPTTAIFSSCVGHPDRYVAIDDLRIYNRALSTSEITRLAEEAAPVEVPLRGIPESGMAVSGAPGTTLSFASKAVLRTPAPFKGTMKLETLDREDKALWSQTVPVDLSPDRKEVPLEWKIPMGEGNDVVYLKASLVGWKANPSWSVKMARIPLAPPQNTSGDMRLGAKVVDIDCTRRPDPALYLDNCGAKVVSTKAGACRETPRKAFSFFSYRFDVKHPGRPHVLRATYPDDKPRIFALDLNDGLPLSPQGSGIQTGFMTRLTGEMQTQDILFWPGTEHCLLSACNWGDAANNNGSVVPFRGETAALARIEVFEVDAPSLPPLKIVAPHGDFPRRNIGMWVEDSSLSSFWCHTPLDSHTLAGWAVGADRLAQYMAYVGADIYQYPVVWYDGTLFQSPTLQQFGNATNSFAGHPKGCFAVLNAAFAGKGVKFFPTFYFRELAALLFQTDSCDPKIYKNIIPASLWNERYRTEHPGGDAMLQYYWNGKTRKSPYNNQGLELPFSGAGPMFNPIHPDVLKIERGMFKDWLDLYGDNPALGGILLDLGLSWGGLSQADSFSFCRLYGGYGDYTAALFEKDTGVKVPGEPNDPDRFKKRYEFLTSGDMKAKWIDWRCRQIRDKVVMPLYRMLRAKRADLTLQIGVGSRPSLGPDIPGSAPFWNEAAKECGIDLDLYRNIPGITIVRHGASSQNVTKCYPKDNLDDSWPPENNGQNGVCTITSSYWEMFSHGKLLDKAKEKWPETKPNQMPVRTMIDAREGVLAHTAYALMKKDVGEIYIGGMGFPATFGHEPVVRPFARAFRSLPKIGFDDIPGLEDPVRARQKTLDGMTYAYLVNAEPYAIPVTLAFTAPPGEIIDLGALKRLDLKSKSLALVVPPYQMVALRFGAASRIERGEASVPESEIAALRKTADAVKETYAYPIKLHPPETPGKHYIWLEAEKWDQWDSGEHYSSKNMGDRIDKKSIRFVSGDGDIGFGGDGKPAVYKNLSCPKPARYSLWVRFTAPPTGNPTKWRAEIDGTKVGECQTPTDPQHLWIKIGEAEIQNKNFEMKFFHQVGAFSAAVDCFLLTDDPAYTPKGPADFKERQRAMDKRFGSLDQALGQGRIAEARARVTALKTKN